MCELAFSGKLLMAAKQFKTKPLILPSTGKSLQAKSIPLVMPNNTEFNPGSCALKLKKGITRDSLVPCDTALELLNTIDKPVAVLSIAGPTRTGKSYILSRLLGDPEAFQLGHTTRACTKGIWMSTSVLECDEFCVVLLDTEGIDAVNDRATNDAKILVTTLLLSSYFIYNSVGVPRNNDLEKMSLFTNMANSVTVHKGIKKSDEYWKCFPPFLWLLRDMLLDLPKIDGRELTPTEFLITEVLGGGDEDDLDSMGVAVRKSLNKCFPSFECKILSPPSTDKVVMANICTSQEKLDESFNQGVDELVAFIKYKMCTKKILNAAGTTCDGPTFAIFITTIIEAVNDPRSIPAIDSTWETVVESRCKAVQEKLVLEYSNTMKQRYDEISKGGPLEEVADKGTRSLMEIHDSLWSELRKKFHDEVGPLLAIKVTELEMVTDQLEMQLIQIQLETDPHTEVRVKRVIGGALFPIIKENHRRSGKFCKKIFTELYTPIRERVETTSGEDGYTPENLAADVKSLFVDYDARSVGPEKWNVRARMEATIEQSKGFFQKHLHEMSQNAKKERERKQMLENLQKELRELTDSRRQKDEQFDEYQKQMQEAEERRRQVVETEIKDLKENLEKQKQKEKELNENKRKIEEEKEIEKRLKEQIKEEASINNDRLNNIIEDEKAEKEKQERIWKTRSSQQEKEMTALSDKIDKLEGNVTEMKAEITDVTADIELYQQKSWLGRMFSPTVRKPTKT